MFCPEKPVEEGKSRAWIRSFIRIREKLFFGVFSQSCAKLAVLFSFGHATRKFYFEPKSG